MSDLEPDGATVVFTIQAEGVVTNPADPDTEPDEDDDTDEGEDD